MIGVTWLTSTHGLRPGARRAGRRARRRRGGRRRRSSRPAGGATEVSPSQARCTSGSRCAASEKVRPSHAPKSVSVKRSSTVIPSPSTPRHRLGGLARPQQRRADHGPDVAVGPDVAGGERRRGGRGLLEARLGQLGVAAPGVAPLDRQRALPVAQQQHAGGHRGAAPRPVPRRHAAPLARAAPRSRRTARSARPRRGRRRRCRGARCGPSPSGRPRSAPPTSSPAPSPVRARSWS